MKIVLKNGKEIFLDWNSIIFEYLEEYEGGIQALKEDLDRKENLIYACNHILYSVLCANYEEELTFRQAVSLIDVNDINLIVDWFNSNSIKMNKEHKKSEKSKEQYKNKKRH